MKIGIKNIIYIVVLLISGLLPAQTVNIGDIYISPNTLVSSIEELDNKATGNLFNDGDLFLYSHYNNDGLATFTTGITTGITRMRSLNGFQNISGSLPIECYNVEFDNAIIQPAFHLTNNLSVTGTANFKKGIIDDDNYGGLLIFQNEAEYINVDNESHVDGKVKKNGNVPFIYPIGDKNLYRFAGITAPEELLSSFNSKYFYDNSNSLYPHVSKSSSIGIINNQEYWTLDKTAGTSDVILTLSWDETTTTPADIIALPQSDIHIVRWDTTQNLWVDEGGIVDSVNKTVTTPINVSGYNVFTTARVDGVILPCSTLTVYNAISMNDDGINDYFKIDGLTECSADNTVEIYNRWGVKVFETSNYGSNGNVFKGYSEGRTTISKGRLLPVGTYFYILNIKYKTSSNTNQIVKKSGYLYLNN